MSHESMLRSTRRIRAALQHLQPKSAAKAVDINQSGYLPASLRTTILDYFDQLRDRPVPNVDLPGPTCRTSTRDEIKQVLHEIGRAGAKGLNHVMFAEIQARYCTSMSDNFVIPFISFTRNNTRPPLLTQLVVLAHPDDCARIAKLHVRKMPDQSIFLGPGVLSTTDNTDWKKQRSHLNQAFLPITALSEKVFPVTQKRARESVWMLRDLAGEDGRQAVDINEFLLHEAMAQLQLGMMGLDCDFVERTNKPLRDAFSMALLGSGATNNADLRAELGQSILEEDVTNASLYIFGFLQDFLETASGSKAVADVTSGNEDGQQAAKPAGYMRAGGDDPAAAVLRSMAAGKRSRGSTIERRELGPLTEKVMGYEGNEENPMVALFNAATFVFAGHDTTANTMTWLLFEACRNADVQAKLQAEADAFFSKPRRAQNHLEYRDLSDLPYLSRCITETLRLWPVVPNGTFRELQFDEEVAGPGGSKVRLPKGTFVQIPNWLRHRNPGLWGDDAAEFDPERAFRGDELWRGRPFAAYNPSSDRFSPFTYGPRSCMGMNFAQMEMRLILVHLLYNFHFELAEPTMFYDPKTFMGINRGTMGPEDLNPSRQGQLPSNGMHMRVISRRSAR